MWVVALIGIAGTTTGALFLTERLTDFFATDFFAERLVDFFATDFLAERLADFFTTDRLAVFLAGAFFAADFFFAAFLATFFFAATGDSLFSHTALNYLVNQRGER